VVEALTEWLATFPPGAVAVSQLPVPDDDDYGLELILALNPPGEGACPIEIGIVKPPGGSTVYILLDRWAAIARRTGTRLADEGRKGRLVGLFVEPAALSAGQVLEVCQAVAGGAVVLEVGVVAGRLVCTSGYVSLPGGRFRMSGVGGPLSLLRLAARFGLAETRRLKYEPWAPASGSGGSTAFERGASP
jgi:hypothetical protein